MRRFCRRHPFAIVNVIMPVATMSAVIAVGELTPKGNPIGYEIVAVGMTLILWLCVLALTDLIVNPA